MFMTDSRKKVSYKKTEFKFDDKDALTLFVKSANKKKEPIVSEEKYSDLDALHKIDDFLKRVKHLELKDDNHEEYYQACTKLLTDLVNFTKYVSSSYSKFGASKSFIDFYSSAKANLEMLGMIPNLTLHKDKSVVLTEAEKKEILKQPYGIARADALDKRLAKEREIDAATRKENIKIVAGQAMINISEPLKAMRIELRQRLNSEDDLQQQAARQVVGAGTRKKK